MQKHLQSVNYKFRSKNSKKLYLGTDEIEAVTHTKFLGTIIDQHSSWEYHICQTKKKVAKGLAIISKAKKLLNSRALISLYHSFVYPYFDYCIEVWGSAAKTHINSLFRMQKKAIRSITMSAFRAESKPLFQKYKFLTLDEIHIYKVALFMFKVHHNTAPEHFKDYFQNSFKVHEYRTRARHMLRVPTYKLEIMKMSIRIKGVYIWNFIHSSLTPNCSPESFKIALNIFLLGNENLDKIIPK